MAQLCPFTRNLSDLKFDLSWSLSVKCDSVTDSPYIVSYWYNNRMSIFHRLAVTATRNVFSYLLSNTPKYAKIWPKIWKIESESALSDLKMTLNPTRPKVPHICSTTRKSHISLSFALRSLVFQIIKVFYFSIRYTGEFEIFEKKNR